MPDTPYNEYVDRWLLLSQSRDKTFHRQDNSLTVVETVPLQDFRQLTDASGDNSVTFIQTKSYIFVNLCMIIS